MRNHFYLLDMMALRLSPPLFSVSKRLRDDYTHTGFKGYGVKTRAGKGHEFGLKLSANEKKALIAFLKTL
jgi:hypothetical protein